MGWVEDKPYSRDPRDTKKSLVRPFLAGRVKRRLALVMYVRLTRKPIKFSLVDASVPPFLSLVDLQVQGAQETPREWIWIVNKYCGTIRIPPLCMIPIHDSQQKSCLAEKIAHQFSLRPALRLQSLSLQPRIVDCQPWWCDLPVNSDGTTEKMFETSITILRKGWSRDRGKKKEHGKSTTKSCCGMVL